MKSELASRKIIINDSKYKCKQKFLKEVEEVSESFREKGWRSDEGMLEMEGWYPQLL